MSIVAVRRTARRAVRVPRHNGPHHTLLQATVTAPPLKTELGQQELKRRKRTLGQRHRTMLLLVDGKRSRDEVLALAQQVGVGPAHFDELIAWGMVTGEPLADAAPAQAPVAAAAADAAPAVAPEGPEGPGAPLVDATAPPPDALPEIVPPPAAAAGADPAVAEEPPPLTDAEPALAAAPAVDEPALAPSDAAATVGDPAVAVVDPPPVAAVEPAPFATAPVEPPELMTLSIAPGPAAPASPRPAPARRMAPSRRGARVASPPLPRDVAPFLPLEAPRASMPVLTEPIHAIPDHIRPVVLDAGLDMALPDDDGDSEEGRLLGEVRSLLIGTLLVDAPVSSSLTALRVHRARDRDSLVRLVWEVERSLVRARRPREAQSRLTRARDLLGLGNTVVHEQTQPGYPGGD